MKKIILKLTVLVSIMFLGMGVSEAASFSVSVGSKSLSKGNTTKLTIKGSDVTGRFNISSSNSSVVSISEDRAWIENDSYTITLSALNVGTSTITITPTSSVSDGTGNKANLSAKTIKITVSLPREKSTDNTLKNLSVEGYEISPSFSKDTLDYTVDVEEGTKNININATANSKYASVSGNGNIEVTEGINNLSIVVRAENGSEKIYNLVVNVIDKNPIYVELDNEKYTIIKLRENYSCPDTFVDSEIVINNIPIPSCTNEKINYVLVGLKKEDGTTGSFIYENGTYKKYIELNGNSIKLINEKYDGPVEGLIETTIEIDGIKYQAFKFNDKSKYSVIYGMNIETGEKGLYLYDEINKTFSGYDRELIDYLTNQNKIYLYVIIAFGCGLFLSLVCVILLSKGKKKTNKKVIENNNEETKNKKKARKDKNENIKENEIIEENNEIKEIESIEETETYYLFDNDKKKKKRK